MKKLFLLVLVLLVVGTNVDAQTLEELKAKKDMLAAQAAEAQAKADGINGEIASLQTEIDKLSGWLTGFAGNIGFNLGGSNNWVASPNPSATTSGLGIGLSAFANKMTDKTMWRNKGILAKSYVDVDQGIDEVADEDGLFDDANGTSDIINVSSLYGYRIHPKFAISALGELNTSLGNFFEPGTIDIGVGGTWTPNDNLVVVVHPLNYHLAFPSLGADFESTGALGLKLRADYGNNYVIAGKEFGLSSTFTTFVPYSSSDEGVPSLFEYTWLNTVSFNLWKGIGVGVGFGLRGADFEIADITQSFYNVGLTYNL